MPVLDARGAHSEDDFQGKARPVAGKYHAAVNAAEEIASKNKGTPGLQIEFAIVADGLPPSGKGTTSGQSGKVISLFLSYVGSDEEKTQTCINRVTRLAMALGVISPGESKEVDWNDAIGRELVIGVVDSSYEKDGQKKISTEVGFLDFWSLGNKAVKDVPRDLRSPGMQQLAKGQVTGGKAPPVAGNGSTAAQQQQPVAAGAAAASSKSKYADL